MSFWQTSTGEQLNEASVSTTFESSYSFDPIPRGTILRVAARSVEWSEYNGDRYINAQWNILDGDYKGRVVFQKIKVLESDAKKRDKALTMLATIDSLTGAGLVRLQHEPTDIDLARLCGKPIEIRVGVYKNDDDPENIKIYNFVEAVGAIGALSGGKQKQSSTEDQVKAINPTNYVAPDNIDDDIPF